MLPRNSKHGKYPPDVRARYSVRSDTVGGRRWAFSNAAHRAMYIAFLGLLVCRGSTAQIYDSLDTHPPRWYLDSSDCDARVTDQGHVAGGGIDGRTCETISLVAANGTEALLVYPIEPVLPIEDLVANVSVMSAKDGMRVGLRIRYPYLRDAETKRPVSVVVYGASYESPGEFASIGVGLLESELRMKSVAMRRQHGSSADLSDAFVDGVVINAYGGPGTTSLKIDELRIDGLVPVTTDGVTTANRRGVDAGKPTRQGPGGDRVESRRDSGDSDDLEQQSAFPVGRVTRILQHNGEPLAWVRSLGFDAVLLAKPPDAALLSEAMRSRVTVYAPPPSSPDPSIESLLGPVAGWYIGMGEALDTRHFNRTQLESDFVRGFPGRWNRPLIAAPSESWRRYATILDAMIDDLPPRSRGVGGGEEVAQILENRVQLGDRVEGGVGILSMPTDSATRQTEAIADAIGTPRPLSFRWHSMWLQAMRSLAGAPRAILFRSTRPLSSGSPLDSQRAMALSYVNRMIAMIGPWVSAAQPTPPPAIAGAPYDCLRLTGNNFDILIVTSAATRGSEVLSGDGTSLQMQLTPNDAAKNAWRFTHFSAERIVAQIEPTGPSLQIVSPDVVEVIVLSSDPTIGSRIGQSAERFARQAALDRWQLSNELVERTREDWLAASVSGAVGRRAPPNLIQVARQTLDDVEPMFRAGNTDTTLRMTRRADAWAMRSQWQLCESLMPDWPNPTSCPPIDFGAASVQVMWRPLMNDQGWGVNRLTSGSLDLPNLIDEGRWTFGQRLAEIAASEVMHVQRGTFQGPGALRARVTPVADQALPGGYGGTIVQISSPSVRVAAGTAVRIDAVVKTLGFGGPHQGLLFYDTVGGQELGILVRGRPDWTPVRLYRQTTRETEVQAMFEVIGGGEVTIDDVQIRLWEPSEQKPRPIPVPIAELESAESTTQ